MKNVLLAIICASLAAAGLACEKKGEEPAKAESAESAEARSGDESGGDESGEETAEEDSKEGTAKTAAVDVPKEGKKFDPAIEKGQLPEGAWVCDMGTVHWAAMEKAEDGKCPVCGMKLTQVGGDAEDGHMHDEMH